MFPNAETINLKPVSIGLLKRILWDIKLPALLKKVNADLFISFHKVCSPVVPIAQFMFVSDLKKIRKTHLKRACLLFVPNKLTKDKLVEKHSVPIEKIKVVYPSANKMFGTVNDEEKAITKYKYSNGKEFFLSNGIFPVKEDFITLLKAFSHFKKRQQSSFKLLLTLPRDPFFEKSLTAYKYRNDVEFIDPRNVRELAVITASAYAAVLPFNNNESLITALNAMRSGTPVIAVRGSIINEVAAEAALYTDSDGIKDIGEKMIQVYTDENDRSKLIEIGKQVAAANTVEKSAEAFWQAISGELKLI
ncbi:MAG TPA: glycosyltransferase [Chitinophagaceae bacterium]